MVLVKERIVYRRRAKPTRFRFKGNIRLGFRNNVVVEVAKFKKRKR